MPEVRLDDDKNPYSAKPRKARGLTGFFIGIGLARNEKEANTVMLILALVLLAGAAYLWWMRPASDEPKPLTPLERARLEASTPPPSH